MNAELMVAKHGVVILMVAKQPEDLLLGGAVIGTI
jgi:hypothetical protein